MATTDGLEAALATIEAMTGSRRYRELIDGGNASYVPLAIAMAGRLRAMQVRPPTPPRAPMPRVAADAPPAVSVVVAARNYGRFLGDAIASAVRQTAPAIEVLYADDGSDDDSLAVARSFPGVIVLPGEHRGVCDARNRGVAAARGNWILHLDGDDVLPNNYLACRLDALSRSPSAAFVYGPAQAFGNRENYHWAVPDWDGDAPARLWTQNWINTSTLVRRDALEAVGGWREGTGTAWDWDQFLRISRAGFAGTADRQGVLLYRRHEGSVSVGDRTADGEGHGQRLLRLGRMGAARTAIGCVLSDRLLGLLPAWADAVRASIEHHATAMTAERPYGAFGDCRPSPPGLHVIYTGDKGRLSEVRAGLDRLLPAVGESSLTLSPQGGPPADETRRRDWVSRLLARSYNRILAQTDAEVVWTIEDDVIVPANALHDLKTAMLGGPTPLPAVAGWYRSRHGAADHLIAHDWPDRDDVGSIRAVREDLAADRRIDLTGTGCLAIFRPLASHAFGSHAAGIAAHDWNWCLGLRNTGEGDRRPLLLASVGCRHHQTIEKWVGPGDGRARLRVLPPCAHRRGRWCCGEGITTCDLGKGTAGIVEKEDCYGCAEAGPK